MPVILTIFQIEKEIEKESEDSDSSGCASADVLDSSTENCFMIKEVSGTVSEKPPKQRSEKGVETTKRKKKPAKAKTKDGGKSAENEVWTKDLRGEIATLAVKISKNGGMQKLEPYRERLFQEALEKETLSQLQELHFRLEALERSL